MTFIACIIPITMFGQPDVAAMSGYLVKEESRIYIVDFSNAASAITSIEGDYSKVRINKSECEKIEGNK